MANFINYRNLDFKLNDQDFYAAQIGLSASASVEPIILSDGSLYDYAPQNAVVGSLSCDFYLTGSLPSFLNITGTDESAITAKFAGVNITGVYIKSLSFNVEPFQPILLSIQCDWYSNVLTENFDNQPRSQRLAKQTPNYFANAYKSYMNTENIFDFSGAAGSSGTSGSSGVPSYAGDQIGNLISFSYNANCDRPAYYKAGDIYPFRVAKLNKTCEVDLSSNALGKMISINGKRAATTIYIKDFYGSSLDNFTISGVLATQNYNISAGQYLLSNAKITQTIVERKTLV